MPTASITITDKTKTPQSLQTLLGQSMQPQANPSGQTLTGVAGYSVLISGAGHGFALIGQVSYLSVQFSTTNAGMIGYIGDENVTNNGVQQGKEMLPGDVDVHQGEFFVIHLGEVFLTANTNNALFNVEWHYS